MESLDLINEILAFRKTQKSISKYSTHTLTWTEYRKIDDMLKEKFENFTVTISVNTVVINIPY